jgi:hypothetical protein
LNKPHNIKDPFGLLAQGCNETDVYCIVVYGDGGDAGDPIITIGGGISGGGGGGGGGASGSTNNNNSQVSRALDAAIGILQGNDGDCTNFFNGNKLGLNPVSALAGRDIVTMNGPDRRTFGIVNDKETLVAPYMWDARFQPGAGGFIQLNQNGAFYQSTIRNQVQGGARLPTTKQFAGPYIGGSLEAQIFILFHELGHILQVLKDDANNPASSGENDQTILDNCKSEIAQAAKDF